MSLVAEQRPNKSGAFCLASFGTTLKEYKPKTRMGSIDEGITHASGVHWAPSEFPARQVPWFRHWKKTNMTKRPPNTGAVLGLGRLSRCGGNNLAFRPGISTSGSGNRSDLQQNKASFHPATPPTFCKTAPTPHPPTHPKDPKGAFWFSG